MQSIFIEAREWFDKSGGNSYFAGRVEVDGKLVAFLPFQYGYESAYEYAALEELKKLGLVPETTRSLWELTLAGFVIYKVKYESTKRDAVRFGKTWQEVAA
jgi:hypothetical protein